MSQAQLRDLPSRRWRADRLRTRSPRSSKHRVEPRLCPRVGSAAKQDHQQARAVAGDRAASLNARPSLPPHQPRVTIRPSLTFERQQPEAFVPPAAAGPALLFWPKLETCKLEIPRHLSLHEQLRGESGLTRLLRHLRAHGLIAKVLYSRRWRASLPGRRAQATRGRLPELLPEPQRILAKHKESTEKESLRSTHLGTRRCRSPLFPSLHAESVEPVPRREMRGAAGRRARTSSRVRG